LLTKRAFFAAQRPKARHRNEQNPVASPPTNQELQGRSVRIPCSSIGALDLRKERDKEKQENEH